MILDVNFKSVLIRQCLFDTTNDSINWFGIDSLLKISRVSRKTARLNIMNKNHNISAENNRQQRQRTRSINTKYTPETPVAPNRRIDFT